MNVVHLFFAICFIVFSLNLKAGNLIEDVISKGNESLKLEVQPVASEETEADLKLYLATALTLVSNEQCSLGLLVYIQALALKKDVLGLADWRRLSKYAHCAKHKPLLNYAFYRQYQLEESGEKKETALLKLILSLEKDYGHWAEYAGEFVKLYKKLQALNPGTNWNKKIAFYQKRLESYQNRRYVLNLSDSDITANVTSHGGEICLNFDDYLYDRLGTDYWNDYFRFEPAIQPVFEQSYYNLCVLGFEWGKTYDITVLKGLKIDSRVLPENRHYTRSIPNKESDLWFAQKDYILSQGGPSQVPLNHVNSSDARLTLYHIFDKNLQMALFRNQFREAIHDGDIHDIVNELGDEIWRSNVALSEGAQNQSIQTQVSLPEHLLNQPGVYLLTAAHINEDEYSHTNLATQWLVVSDVALSSYRGADGLTVVAHSMQSAEPLMNVDIRLFSKNNHMLSHQNTDMQGKVFIPRALLEGRAGREAVHLTAHSAENGFLLYPLNQSTYDLSERGVAGRLIPGYLDALLTTERGIYRPGETVNFTALLRDLKGNAVNGLPLTLELSNPQGELAQQMVITPEGAGGYVTPIVINSGAKTGLWSAKIYGEDAESALANVEFEIAAIVPPKIKLDVTMVREDPRQSLTFEAQADYYYGAPATQVPIYYNESYLKNERPFPQYAEFRFGTNDFLPVMEFDELKESTDNTGQHRQGFSIVDLESIKQPLTFSLHTRVQDDDGRSVNKVLNHPIYHLPFYLGVKPRFQSPVMEKFGPFLMDWVTLNSSGEKIIVKDVSWQLDKMEVHSQWHYVNGTWDYQQHTEIQTVKQSSLDLKKTYVDLGEALEDGRYRFILKHPDGIETHYEFEVGYTIVGNPDAPDGLSLSLDALEYADDAKAQLTLNTNKTGFADVVIASNTVHDIIQQPIDEQNKTVSIPVKAEWGAGAYALVSFYQEAPTKQTTPKRAVGVVWLAKKKQPHQLTVDVQLSKKIAPGQTLALPIAVKGGNGPQVYATVALVDEAVLKMTQYKAMNPLEFFFAKRQLGVGMNDTYSHLIASYDEDKQKQRFGGDASGLSYLPYQNIQILSYYSGIVKLNNNNGVARTTLPINIPEFQGKARLMVIVWDEQKLGYGGRQTVIRDSVVVHPLLPRFLAVQDKSHITLRLHNLEGPAGSYTLAVENDDVLMIPTGQRHHQLELGNNARTTLHIPITAKSVGNSSIKVSLSGPNNYRRQYELNLGVRWPSLPVQERQSYLLEPGKSLQLMSQSGEYEAKTLEDRVSVSSKFNLNVMGLLQSLEKYPYGCLEQLVSRATPLLHYNTLAELWDVKPDDAFQKRVQKAIKGIVNKQRWDGSYGLWSSDDESELWLTAYAVDFLGQAQKQRYDIPEMAIDDAVHWLKQMVSQEESFSPEHLMGLAYAHYVLAKNGQGTLEEARYLAREYGDQLPTLMVNAQLASALSIMGERQLARSLLDLTSTKQLKRQVDWQWHDYGSALRDMAAWESLLSEHRLTAKTASNQPLELSSPHVLEWINEYLTRQTDILSTQEQAWLIRLALTLGDSSPFNIKRDGNELTPGQNQAQFSLESLAPNLGTVLQNQSANKSVWVNRTISGVKMPKPEQKNGVQLNKTYYHLDGRKAELKQLKQGQKLFVLIEGEATTGLPHRLLLVDMLAAGLEINLRDEWSLVSKKLLDMTSGEAVRYHKRLDDRYIAAIDIKAGKKQQFVASYIVNVVTPGNYQQPGSEVFDMYNARYRAYTGSGQLRINL